MIRSGCLPPRASFDRPNSSPSTSTLHLPTPGSDNGLFGQLFGAHLLACRGKVGVFWEKNALSSPFLAVHIPLVEICWSNCSTFWVSCGCCHSAARVAIVSLVSPQNPAKASFNSPSWARPSTKHPSCTNRQYCDSLDNISCDNCTHIECLF